MKSIFIFFYTNWILFLIYLFDTVTEFSNYFVINNLDNSNIYYKKLFDSLSFNFIYILLPFYNIGLKIASSNNIDYKIEFTNMLKLNLIISSFLTYVCYFSQSFYF